MTGGTWTGSPVESPEAHVSGAELKTYTGQHPKVSWPGTHAVRTKRMFPLYASIFSHLQPQKLNLYLTETGRAE